MIGRSSKNSGVKVSYSSDGEGSTKYWKGDGELRKDEPQQPKKQPKKLYKRIRKSWLVIALVLLVGYGLFYWFAMRPSNIRQYCSEQSSNFFQKNPDTKYYYLIYNNCLHSRGL